LEYGSGIKRGINHNRKSVQPGSGKPVGREAGGGKGLSKDVTNPARNLTSRASGLTDINRIKQPRLSKAAQMEVMRKGIFVPAVWGTAVGRSLSAIDNVKQPRPSKRLEREVMRKGVYVPRVWGIAVSAPHHVGGAQPRALHAGLARPVAAHRPNLPQLIPNPSNTRIRSQLRGQRISPIRARRFGASSLRPATSVHGPRREAPSCPRRPPPHS